MQNKKLSGKSSIINLAIAFLIIGCGILGGGRFIFAVTTPGNSSQGPSQAEIDAMAAKQRPGDEQMKQFEKDFGGPPQSFPAPTIEKPQFEQPGTVPDEVKKYVSDKDLVSVYCAMAKWKSGQFFLAMDAVKKYVIEPSQQIKSDFGIDFSIPDIDAIKAEGERRVKGICDASTASEAEKLAADFADWGRNQNQSKFDAMRVEMQDKLTAKGNALHDKIRTELQPFIDEQTSGIDAEMKTLADQIVEQKKAEITARLMASKTQPDINAVKSEITEAVTSTIQAKIEQKKSELQAKIQAKIQELSGPDIAKFQKIGDAFQNVSQNINDYIKANQSQYDQYKTQAFDLRKKLVFSILDKNIAEGMAKLDAASADLAEAKKNDPSVKSAEEIKAELQQDRKDLEVKLDAALASGDENAFQQALNDFRAKWEAIQLEGEKAMQQSVSKVCAIALAQFDKANAQMDPGVKKIKDLQAKCANSTTDECLKISQFSSRFETILSKFADLKTEMSLASGMCKNPDAADRANMIALMKKIQSDAEDVKVYGAALEADKTKMLAETTADICNRALPQLDAADNEIKKNDLTVLQNNVDKCKGKTTEECGAVNKLSGDLNGLKGQIASFDVNVNKAKSLCAAPSGEADIKTLGDTLNMLKSEGDVLRNSANDLQAKQSEKMNDKILCRAVVPEMESAKQEITGGLLQTNALQAGCAGKSDARCSVINSNGDKFSALKNQTQTTLNKIASINSMCSNASADSLNPDLVSALDGIKGDKDIINKMIADLKALEAAAGKTSGITIEAENESSTNLLPRTETWHSIKGKSNESWRPPVFGTGYWYLSRGGESLTYNFTAPKDGQYNVWVRDYVDNFQPKGVRRIVVSFDGKNYGTFPENTAPVPADNKIGVFAWHKVGGGVTFKTGSHTMKITKEATTSGAAILDSFYLTTGSEVPPEK